MKEAAWGSHVLMFVSMCTDGSCSVCVVMTWLGLPVLQHFARLKKVYRGDPRNSGARTRAADFCGCPEAGAREHRQQGALGDQTAALTGVLKEEEAVKEKDELLREAQAEAARERQLRSIELKDDCCPVRGGDKTQTDTGEMAVGRQAETGVPAEETLSDDTWTSDFQPPEQCRNSIRALRSAAPASSGVLCLSLWLRWFTSRWSGNDTFSPLLVVNSG
ncbi:uncharacterized protein [Manis javanica]|uniref:uncharacterized protein isoform X3 n=1 Tax=Manis javanica TaxID=9974 RepID=UPI003C6D51A4